MPYKSAEDTRAYHLRRRLRMKLRAVTYKGGVCQRCGWTGHPAGFDFHHRDPEEKEFQWSTKLYKQSWETITRELDKCELLCAICHRIEHASPLEDYGA